MLNLSQADEYVIMHTIGCDTRRLNQLKGQAVELIIQEGTKKDAMTFIDNKLNYLSASENWDEYDEFAAVKIVITTQIN